MIPHTHTHACIHACMHTPLFGFFLFFLFFIQNCLKDGCTLGSTLEETKTRPPWPPQYWKVLLYENHEGYPHAVTTLTVKCNCEHRCYNTNERLLLLYSELFHSQLTQATLGIFLHLAWKPLKLPTLHLLAFYWLWLMSLLGWEREKNAQAPMHTNVICLHPSCTKNSSQIDGDFFFF